MYSHTAAKPGLKHTRLPKNTQPSLTCGFPRLSWFQSTNSEILRVILFLNKIIRVFAHFCVRYWGAGFNHTVLRKLQCKEGDMLPTITAQESEC